MLDALDYALIEFSGERRATLTATPPNQRSDPPTRRNSVAQSSVARSG